MTHSLTFIGTIHSSLKKLEDCPRQENEKAPEAELVILPEFLEGIKNIEAGSQILLLTWLHKADRKVIACKPRNDETAAVTGVFSTRSPDRPNPIGLHNVRVLSVSKTGTIKVSGLEVLDQTPLLDIKPVWKTAT